jgi:DNA-binding MarR family transcriptional regulator
MKHYVYVIQNIINLKIYVGYSCNPKERWMSEKCTAFAAKDPEYNKPFYRSIRKYGWNNFTKQIIEEFDDKQEALNAEMFWIEYFRADRNKYGKECGYNLHEGGRGPNGISGDKHHGTKLNIKQKQQVFNLYCEGNLSTYMIAKMYNVKEQTISRAIKKIMQLFPEREKEIIAAREKVKNNCIERMLVGENNHNAKLSNKQRLELYDAYMNENITLEKLGKRYGITKSSTGKIIRSLGGKCRGMQGKQHSEESKKLMSRNRKNK